MGADVEVQPGVLRQGDQHVIEKRKTRFDLRASGATAHFDSDFRLGGFSNDYAHAENSCATAPPFRAAVYKAIPRIAAEIPAPAKARKSSRVEMPPDA